MKQVAAIALGNALAAALLLLAFSSPSAANPADNNPLRPVDTSNPRATLQGFVTAMDEVYRGMKDILQEYDASGRLHLTAASDRSNSICFQTRPRKRSRFSILSDISPIRETPSQSSERCN